MRNKNKIKSKRWNYLAGLIDGDGHISIQAHEHQSNYTNYDTILGVTTTHKPTAKWLVDVFGGKFTTTKDKRPNRKIRYFWYCSSALHQLSILENIKDKLILKKDQANLLIQFLNLGGKRFQNPEVRKEIFKNMKDLNSFYIPVFQKNKCMPSGQVPTKDFYQYLAGLLDAEGCISLYENKRSFDPRIYISNTDMRTFCDALNYFGGTVSSYKRKNRALGTWSMPTKYLEKTLLAAIPYMVTKREQAIILLTWLRKRNILSDDESRIYVYKFRLLNQRGLAPTTNTANTLISEDRV